MPLPWETPQPEPEKPSAPFALPPVDPIYVKDPVTGLYPGQRHELDIPDFLRR